MPMQMQFPSHPNAVYFHALLTLLPRPLDPIYMP